MLTLITSHFFSRPPLGQSKVTSGRLTPCSDPPAPAGHFSRLSLTFRQNAYENINILNLPHFLPISEERSGRSCVAGTPGDWCECLGRDKAWQREGSGITQSLPRRGKWFLPFKKPYSLPPSARNFLNLVKGPCKGGRSCFSCYGGWVAEAPSFPACSWLSSMIPLRHPGP